MRTRTVIKADGRGRILLPRDMRERLGIGPGAGVDVEATEEGTVVLRDLRAERWRQLTDAKGSLKGRIGSVDELIAERRAEAARELDEH